MAAAESRFLAALGMTIVGAVSVINLRLALMVRSAVPLSGLLRLGAWVLRGPILRVLGLALPLLYAACCSADCIPFYEAAKHVGETRCVTGKVFDVQQGAGGHHYLDFCEDYRVCPFTVVVFSGDLRHVGDVRKLKGNVVEIHGDVKEYDGRAEIILREARQLRGEAVNLPPLPKNYDVEKKGRYSAGRITYAKSPRKTTPRQKSPIQTEEIDVPQ